MKKTLTLLAVLLIGTSIFAQQRGTARDFWFRPITVNTNQIKPAPTALGKTIVSVPANADSTSFKWGVGDAQLDGNGIIDATQAGLPIVGDTNLMAYAINGNGFFLGKFDDVADVGYPWNGGYNAGFSYSPDYNGDVALVYHNPTGHPGYAAGYWKRLNIRDGEMIAGKDGSFTKNCGITLYPATGKVAIISKESPDNSTYTFQDASINIASGAASAKLIFGTGTPEGVITANVGSLYMRSDGGAGTSMYVKESGTGNTGWVAK